jgi:CRP/FNR family transcriptional regulator, cyclic AMP receptor protein
MDHVAVFKRTRSEQHEHGDDVQLPHWSEAEWQTLFAVTTPRPIKASEVVIQRGVADRALYFVAAGLLEVGVTYVDGVSISPIARIAAGSVVGEQSFFDAQPRSANVWAVTAGELLCLTPERFHALADQKPVLARDLVFALGRILSLRLRHTTVRIRR